MNESIMLWDDVRYVLAIARGGSLAAASKALGVSAPTVGRRLDALEAALGARLFLRRKSGFIATDAGASFVARAEGVELSMRELERGVAGFDERTERPVRVATFDTGAHDLLVPELPRFFERHPHIRLEFVIGQQTAGLARGEAHLALRTFTSEDSDLLVRKVGSLAFALYRARAPGPKPALEPWPELPVVMWDDSLAHLLTSRWLREHVPARLRRLSFNNFQGQLAAVRAGAGAGLLPCLVGDQDPRLERLSPPLEALLRPLYLVQLPELRASARVRAVAEFVVDVVGRRRAALLGELKTIEHPDAPPDESPPEPRRARRRRDR
jgi:DNA-binding transcriptional LysR family regulator